MKRILSLIAAMTMSAAGLMAVAPSASADQVWYQSFERPSATAPCVAPADQTPWQDTFEGQKEWTPSWAEWANGGKGGWVCERYIVWAKETPPPTYTFPGVNCAAYSSYYAHFDGSWFIVGDGSVPMYGDPDCTNQVSSFHGMGLVFAPGGAAQGDLLCHLKFPLTVEVRNFGVNQDTYYCVGPNSK